jgi:hypothetical protein
MNTATLRFDDVLHVHRNPWTRFTPKHTVFSFMADGEYTPYVTVHGWPRLEPGMSVTAVLERDGDRRSLVGWVDHATGELAGPNTNGQLVRLLTTAATSAVALTIGFVQARSGHSLAVFIALAGLALAAFAVTDYREWRRGLIVHRLLSQAVRAHAA